MPDDEITRLREEITRLRAQNTELWELKGANEERIRLVEDNLAALLTSMAGMMIEFRDGILRSSPVARDGGEDTVDPE